MLGLAILNSYVLLSVCGGEKICHTDIFDSLFEGNGGTCWTRTMGIEAIRERPMNTATNAGRLDCSGSEHWCVLSKQLGLLHALFS